METLIEDKRNESKRESTGVCTVIKADLIEDKKKQ
jgi:hypothetical protein